MRQLWWRYVAKPHLPNIHTIVVDVMKYSTQKKTLLITNGLFIQTCVTSASDSLLTGVHIWHTFTKNIWVREGVRKKTLYFLWSFAKPPLGPPLPPRYGLFTDKKNYPYFFWKLNLWLPKRILHLVPLKNLSFLSSYNGLLFPLIDYSKGRGDHQGSHKVPLSKLSY